MQVFRSLRTWLTVLIFAFTAVAASAQSITTGDVSGTVTDSTGAVLSSVTVTLKDLATGAVRTATTNDSGAYRASLLKPGKYAISAAAKGLTTATAEAEVSVGQVQVVNLVASPEAATQTVEVTDSAPLLNTENANVSTSFNQAQLNALPTPGGDITSVAYTAPGVVVSTGAGFGNFSSFGLPATSNLFTLNGNDNMDPYLNVNTSGASNLTLGQSEVQEAVIVQNGYSGQYGRQAGAQVNYTTKSGANAFHGDAKYYWNGSVLNANDWFNNETNTPKARANSNQWAGSVSGPIKKDKLFFFYSNEGIRYVLPTSGTVALPSAQFQQFILGRITAAQTPFYQQAFNLFNNAPGASRGVEVKGKPGASGPLQDATGNWGCGSFKGLVAPNGGIFGTTVSCASAFNTNVSNENREWLQTGRVDWNVSDRQKLFFRYKEGHGLQPTATDPISPLFNVESNQPQWEGQLNHSFILGPNTVNNFIFSSNYSSAIFAPKDLAASVAALPDYFRFFDGGANGANGGVGGFTNLGLNFGAFPQGRRVSQYSFVDDFSTTHGIHAIKFGVNLRRDNVADLGPQTLASGGRYTINDITDFGNGTISAATGSSFQQRFSQFPSAHIGLLSLGLYIQDEVAVKRNLKLSLSLRADINQDPTCNGSCFSRLNGPFANLTKDVTIPYNRSITTGLDSAFPSLEAVTLQPRFGFSYSPFGSTKTVLRGGVGIFSDVAPGVLASNIFNNSPNIFTPSVRTGSINGAGAGSSPVLASAAATAFRNGFTNGQTLAQISAGVDAATGLPNSFTPPAFFSVPDKLLNPKFLEWNFEVQRQLDSKSSLSVNYVGNHGYNLFILNSKANAFVNAAGSAAGFIAAGIPSAAPDARFRIVTDLSNRGISNYDGLVTTYRRSLGYGFQGEVSYTWSHALDEVSNGGLNLAFSGDSLTSQLDPNDLRRLNYSNSDYDIRHSLTGDFVWTLPYKFANRAYQSVLGDWTFSGKYYWRAGTPFSVFNSSLPGRISNSVGGAVLANVINPNVIRSCENPLDPCFKAADFSTSATQTTFGNLRRNSFNGPRYQDADFGVNKRLFQLERVGVTVGAQFANVFNHPNFASPNQDVATGAGSITSTVGAPSSPYGSFQGSAVSGRVIVLTAGLHF